MDEFRRHTLRISALIFLLFYSLLCISSEANDSAVSIELTNKFGEFSVSSRNAEISLDSTIVIETKLNNEWKKILVNNFYLRESCSRVADKCVKLAANSRLKVVAWTGKSCSSQCPSICRANITAAPGTYRIVLRSCDSETRYYSAEFDKLK